MHRLRLAAAIAILALAGCESAKLAPSADVGPRPELPEPRTSFIPTVDIAPATGWPPGESPVAAAGLGVKAFAVGLKHPRWLLVLPNGDVLVAEANKPKQDVEPEGFMQRLRAFAMKHVMQRAGAGAPSADRITLLRDADGDGAAETRSVFLQGLHSPFGMALVGDHLYVANADGIVRFPYAEGATRIDAPAEKVTELPGGPRNHHWTKNILPSRDGSKLYATVGSNSNAAEFGMEEERGRAMIWEVDLATGAKREFATGLRNPNGLGWEPRTGVLWTVVNERDELGSDLVPDYLTRVTDGGFYGWPWFYWGDKVDERVEAPAPQKPVLRPDYALGNHVAPLGLAFAEGAQLGEAFGEGAFVGLHGSWNRRPPSGYKVVFVPFGGGEPVAGPPRDVLTGFLDAEGNARGRPVGVAIDKRGALLVADDVGNAVWRVAAP